MGRSNSNPRQHKRIVVKLGTSTLTGGTQFLSQSHMVDLVRQMCELRRQGYEVLLVTSGAIAVGRAELGFPDLPKDIPAKQMLAAVGQPRLMDIWGKLFAIYQITVAQVLLTRGDLSSRSHYLNARNTLLALISHGAIPIVNENDTVATEEIRVGDNDNLSALVANLVDADLLLLLTDQDGLFQTDPRLDPEAELVRSVDGPEIEESLWNAAGGGGKYGVGGMVTKLEAADLARRSGVEVVIANGSTPDILLRVTHQEPVGTRFSATTTAVESRKRYILSGGQAGRLVVDAGAVTALQKGGSLLPAGVTEVVGQFQRGATLGVWSQNGEEIARGIVNYDHKACERLRGKRSSEIEAVAGYFYGDELIHRSDLVLL
ncbi:MAG TPA: glutamate 5-kinase [Anaerolineales bacterium]|nr:glutamate 5-kinase [Anaerolineales bacterium]